MILSMVEPGEVEKRSAGEGLYEPLHPPPLGGAAGVQGKGLP